MRVFGCVKSQVRNESEGETLCFAEVGIWLTNNQMHYRPNFSFMKGLRKSISVRTRKMVNYT